MVARISELCVFADRPGLPGLPYLGFQLDCVVFCDCLGVDCVRSSEVETDRNPEEHWRDTLSDIESVHAGGACDRLCGQHYRSYCWFADRISDQFATAVDS